VELYLTLSFNKIIEINVVKTAEDTKYLLLPRQ
jgi:hypothetical protein